MIVTYYLTTEEKKKFLHFINKDIQTTNLTEEDIINKSVEATIFTNVPFVYFACEDLIIKINKAKIHFILEKLIIKEE